ncbi:hypothetical protein C8J57DRAFT_1598100 [Mycena rebaudengoi]|nr:hypothetical protein C8J57DRAFT_1598100 [Mycena rebaudengoi]
MSNSGAGITRHFRGVEEDKTGTPPKNDLRSLSLHAAASVRLLTVHAGPVPRAVGTGDNSDQKVNDYPPRFFSSPPRHSAPHKRVPTPHDYALYPRPPPLHFLLHPRSRRPTHTTRSRHQRRTARSHRQTRPTHSTLDSCHPDVQSHFPRLTALIHATPYFLLPYFSFFLSVSSRAPPRSLPESAPCAHMLRSAAADSERRLAAETYALAESQYGSISRAPAREPWMRSVPPRLHTPHRAAACEGEKGRALGARAHVCKAALGKNASPRRLEHPRRVFGFCPRPRIDSYWRGVLAPCPVRWRAREERLPDPPRVARAQSLRTLRTFDSLHASPARGVLVACTLARNMRDLRTRSQQTAPATLARSLCRLESHGRRFVHAHAVSTRAHRFVSGLPFSSAARARFLSSKNK